MHGRKVAKMSSKRMFSIDMISSDAFLEMPLTAQGLYFHLCLRADDDGFMDSPKKAIRECQASLDDLEILKKKRYILTFPSGIVLIKHWFIHNTIPKDRYHVTRYTEEKALVKLKTNNSYTECIQIDDKLETEIRLDKNRLDKINNSCSSDDERESASKENFEIIYALYPKKSGKAKALELYMQWKKGRKLSGFSKPIKLTNKQMYLATKKYVEKMNDEDTELKFYKSFDTFMNKAILDYVTEGNDG